MRAGSQKFFLPPHLFASNVRNLMCGGYVRQPKNRAYRVLRTEFIIALLWEPHMTLSILIATFCLPTIVQCAMLPPLRLITSSSICHTKRPTEEAGYSIRMRP